MANPSETDIEKAKAYLRLRLSAEKSMADNLDIALHLAAEKILKLCKKYSVTPANIDLYRQFNWRFDSELKVIIMQLNDDLYYICEELCVCANNEDKEHIIAFINTDVYGMNVRSRISKHTDTFLLGLLTYLMVKQSYPKTMDKTYLPQSKGRNALNLLLRDTIARTYMDEWKEMHKEDSIGFIAKRGSSYPCTTCDDYTGFHTWDDYQLPLHPNCCCFAVPVFK